MPFTDGPRNAKAKIAFAIFAFGGNLVREKGRCPVRKPRYLRYRRVLLITKAVLTIIIFILIIVTKVRNL